MLMGNDIHLHSRTDINSQMSVYYLDGSLFLSLFIMMHFEKTQW